MEDSGRSNGTWCHGTAPFEPAGNHYPGDCKKHIEVFGESHIDEIAEKFGIPVLAKLPIDPEITKKCDEGKIQELDLKYMDEALDLISK